MIKLFGPKVPQYKFKEDAGEMVCVELDGFESEAKSLRHILTLYGKKYGFQVSPYNNQIPEIQLDLEFEPKYFWIESVEVDDMSLVVDIHVKRNGESICVKQNLDFALMAGDKVMLGPLAC